MCREDFDWLPRCALCKESVNIERGKTDERGRAVHGRLLCLDCRMEAAKTNHHPIRADMRTAIVVRGVSMMNDTPEGLRNQIADLHSEAARLRAESDRLLKLSVRVAETIERIERSRPKIEVIPRPRYETV
jgi:hypothetical protein